MNINVKSVRNVEVTSSIDAHLLIGCLCKEPRSQCLPVLIQDGAKTHWFIDNSGQHDLRDSLWEDLTRKNSDAKLLTADVFATQFSLWRASHTDDYLHIFVDISAMPRPLMAQVFEALFKAAEQAPLAITVGYVIAAFTPPPTSLPANEDIRPISEAFTGWPSEPSATTTLIVGLGYEQEKAEGACEYFDPHGTWVFVPTSPISEYDEAVAQNNENLIHRARRKNNEQTYSVTNPSQTFGQLASLVSNLVAKENPVLLPFGPKIFFALSLVVAAIYSELGVWYVTGDAMAEVGDHKASNHSVGFRIEIGPKISQSF